MINNNESKDYSYGIIIPKDKIQIIKEFLMNNNLIDYNYQMKTDTEFGYIPVSIEKFNIDKIKKIIKENYNLNVEIKKTYFTPNHRIKSLKESLKDKLNEKELKLLKTSYDIIGDIAILEIDDALVNKEKIIANEILKLNKSIKTVVKKSGSHSGVFRIQKHIFLAGEKKFISYHRENGVILKVDINKMYFSPRLSTERLRIAKLVKPNEKVLVMFSGCAPYPCVISKNSEAKEIIGIELNPIAHKFGLDNIKLNKLKNIKLINGDVRLVVPQLKEKYDRILMPLPMNSSDFLNVALSVVKKGTIIHVYDFVNKSLFNETIDKTKNKALKLGYKLRVDNLIKCGQFAPSVFRICLDCVIT